MRSVAIVLDGVLRKSLDAESRDMGGALLFRSLLSQFRVVLLGSPDTMKDEHFLLVNGLHGHVRLEPVRQEDLNPRLDQLRRLRSEGYRFEFVVVPDPVFGVELLGLNQPVLVYAHPAYSVPVPKGIKPWQELESRVDHELESRAKAAQGQ